MEQMEEQIAHLQRTVDELSGVIAKQDTELRRLTRHVEWLMERERTREAETSGGIVLGDERPPHY